MHNPDTKLEALRRRIATLEGTGRDHRHGHVNLGVEAIDGHLPWGGIPLGCLHEIHGSSVAQGPATAFAAIIGQRIHARDKRPLMWISETETLYAPAMAAHGLGSTNLIYVRTPSPEATSWVLEEALRAGVLSAVVAEANDVSLTASRRFQLAAETSGTTGIILASLAGHSPSVQ